MGEVAWARGTGSSQSAWALRLWGCPGPTGYRLDGFGHLYWLASKGLNVLRGGGRENRGKGSSPVPTHFFYTAAVWTSKMQTWSAPDLLTLTGLLLTSRELQRGHSVLLWSGRSCGPHTPAVLGLAVLSLISSSWHEESCLGFLWILRLVWLTPLHPSCLTSGIAFLRPPPQMPSPPSYLWSLSGIGKLSLKTCYVLLSHSVRSNFLPPRGL